MVAKTMAGARAKVIVDNVVVGIFDSISYSVNISSEAVFTLGKFGAQEIVPTAMETVNVSCSGFRLIDNGGHVLPKFPKLQDLINLESVRLDVVDRQTGKAILTVEGCIPTSYSTGYQAKSLSRIQVSYTGIKAMDESSKNDAELKAVELP